MIKRIIIPVILVFLVFILILNSIRIEALVVQKNVYESPFFKYEIENIATNVQIIEKTNENPVIGFDTGIGDISFGMIPTGGSYGTRYLNISNNGKGVTKIKLEARGSISSMIIFKENNFLIYPEERYLVPIILQTTGSTEIGDYDGEIVVTSIEEKNVVAEQLLGLL